MPLSPRTLRPSSTFTPKSISGLALWLDGSDANSLYTTDAGAVTAVTAPTDISGCALWLDASDASSITESGGLVSQWNDKSGNARHATATTTARPTTGTRTVGGRNALDFNGTSNVMTLGGTVIPTAATHTVFLVYQLDTASQSRFSTLLSSSPAGDQEMRVVGFGSTAIDFYFNGNLGRFLTTTAIGLGPVVFSAREATKSVRSAGAGVFSTGSGDAYAWASNPITLGGRPSANWMDGLLCEVIIFSSTLSDADTARVEAYLAQRWGISGVHVPATATSDPVGAWLDKSGNGRHATQSTAASRPTRGAAIQNNKSSIAFAGSPAQYMGTAVTGNDSGLFTVFAVARHQGTGGGSGVLVGERGGNFTTAMHFAVGSTRLQVYHAGSTETLSAPTGNVANIFTLTKTGSLAYDLRRNAATEVSAVNALATGFNLANLLRNIGASTAGANPLNGNIYELIAYGSALSAAERFRIERYLAAKWGITLAPQVSNADAQNWIDRVYANGGTVTSATASAVNTFCDSITNASLRDRFYRLNLFCGTGLNAALVPLYRGPSLGGTQYGNTTDTNNAFVGVGTDYAETGASGGLTGNGSTKYLATGLNLYDAGVTETGFHASGYFNANTSTTGAFLGCVNSTNTRGVQWFPAYPNAPLGMYLRVGGVTNSGLENAAVSSRMGHLIGCRRPDGVGFLNGANINGTSITSGSGSWTASSSTPPLYVFARNDAQASPSLQHFAGRCCGYSVGLAITDAQAAAFYTAMQAFQTAMGRQV